MSVCGVAVEVRGRGCGRLRLSILPDATADSLTAFVIATTTAHAVVHPVGWQGCKRLGTLDYEHRPFAQKRDRARR